MMLRWLDGINGRQPPRDDRRSPPRPPRDDGPPPRQPPPPPRSALQLPRVSGTVLLEQACITVVVTAVSALCWWGWNYCQSLSSLRTYGRDITGQGDPVIGRDDEIDRVIDILCRRTKNCAALVGAAGVGKTAIAEGLAQRIASGAVPDALAGARVVEVDLGAMVAGTTLRGMFEERIKSMIKQAEASDGKVILFIDEMHMLCSVGGSREDKSTSASNMLKPALARGRIRCVGATTFDEYRQYVEKDPALERRFQKVQVEEPTTEATIAILRGLKERYQEHHGLEIQDAALVAAAHLGSRYITGTSRINLLLLSSLICRGQT